MKKYVVAKSELVIYDKTILTTDRTYELIEVIEITNSIKKMYNIIINEVPFLALSDYFYSTEELRDIRLKNLLNEN